MRPYHLFSCLLLFNVRRNHAESSCEPEFLEKCIKMGKEFFDHPENIFPSNATDIDRVCSDVFPKMWSDFIGCTKSFAATCISSSELSQFNRAVGNSINSVHKMCTNEDYQKDYLKSAICIKKAAIEEAGCKIFYDSLLTEINSPSEAATLCCAHTAFKNCLMEETKSCSSCTDGDNCQGNAGQATTFARIIVENAIGFLLNRCSKSSGNNVCQKFTPVEQNYNADEAPDSFNGNYFPSPMQSGQSENHRTSASPPSHTTKSHNTERTPKEQVDEEPRAYDDEEEKENNSINFDEFFDLAVYKNQFLSSKSSSLQVFSASVLFTCLILSLFSY